MELCRTPVYFIEIVRAYQAKSSCCFLYLGNDILHFSNCTHILFWKILTYSFCQSTQVREEFYVIVRFLGIKTMEYSLLLKLSVCWKA